MATVAGRRKKPADFRFEAQNSLAAQSDAGSPFVEALPPIAQCLLTPGSAEMRDLELLRTVEALRMHAAQHGAGRNRSPT